MRESNIMKESNIYTPLELYKLCCNVIVKNIYHYNYLIFNERLNELNLPDEYSKLIIDRYLIINHIISIESKNCM